MTAQELIERLQEFVEAYGRDCEVRLATQQSWPFENSIRGCIDSVELGPEDDEEDLELDLSDTEPIFYIVEGSQIGYFRKDAWEACS